MRHNVGPQADTAVDRPIPLANEPWIPLRCHPSTPRRQTVRLAIGGTVAAVQVRPPDFGCTRRPAGPGDADPRAASRVPAPGDHDDRPARPRGRRVGRAVVVGRPGHHRRPVSHEGRGVPAGGRRARPEPRGRVAGRRQAGADRPGQVAPTRATCGPCTPATCRCPTLRRWGSWPGVTTLAVALDLLAEPRRRRSDRLVPDALRRRPSAVGLAGRPVDRRHLTAGDREQWMRSAGWPMSHATGSVYIERHLRATTRPTRRAVAGPAGGGSRPWPSDTRTSSAKRDRDRPGKVPVTTPETGVEQGTRRPAGRAGRSLSRQRAGRARHPPTAATSATSCSRWSTGPRRGDFGRVLGRSGPRSDQYRPTRSPARRGRRRRGARRRKQRRRDPGGPTAGRPAGGDDRRRAAERRPRWPWKGRLASASWNGSYAPPHTSFYTFEPAIARPDTAVVLLAIRWSSHGFGEVRAVCEPHGKLARPPSRRVQPDAGRLADPPTVRPRPGRRNLDRECRLASPSPRQRCCRLT